MKFLFLYMVLFKFRLTYDLIMSMDLGVCHHVEIFFLFVCVFSKYLCISVNKKIIADSLLSQRKTTGWKKLDPLNIFKATIVDLFFYEFFVFLFFLL